MSLTCLVRSCKYNCNSECECPGGATISDEEPTAAGFIPMCKSLEEMGGGEDG